MSIKKIPCGGFYTSDGNFTEIDGKKVLTPLGAYRVTKHKDVTTLIDNENMLFSQAGSYNFMISTHGVILDASHTYTFVVDGTRFENLIPYKRVYLTDPPDVEYHIGAYFTGSNMDFSEYPFVVTPQYIVLPDSSDETHVITLIDESVGSEVTITHPMDKSLFFDFGIKATFTDDSQTFKLIEGSYESIKNALTNGKIVVGYLVVEGVSHDPDGNEYHDNYCEQILMIAISTQFDSISCVTNDGEIYINPDNTVTN